MRYSHFVKILVLKCIILAQKVLLLNVEHARCTDDQMLVDQKSRWLRLGREENKTFMDVCLKTNDIFVKLW